MKVTMLRSLTRLPNPLTRVKLSTLIRRQYASTEAVASNQSLYVWGTNSSGSLFDLPSKVEVPTLVDWRLKLDGRFTSNFSLGFALYANDCSLCISNHKH